MAEETFGLIAYTGLSAVSSDAEAAAAAADRAEAAAEAADGSAGALIADAFSTSTAYAVGDYVVYSGVLYRFTANHAAGAWNASDVVEVTAGGELADVKSAISKVDGYFDVCENMFNPNDPDIIDNYELKQDGTTASKTGYFVSGYYPVKAGQTLCVTYPTGTYGSGSRIVLYNASKVQVDYVSGATRETDSRGYGYLKYTFSSNATAVYFRVTGYMAYKPYIMYVYAAEMPSTYIPYTDKLTLSDDVDVPFDRVSSVQISKADTDFVKLSPKNLNNRATMVQGIINNSTSNGDLDTSVTNWYSTDFIPVEVGEVYKLIVAGGVYYGAGYKGIPYYDANKAYKGHIVPAGGIKITRELDTITIPAGAAYIRTSYPIAYYTTPKQWYNTQIFKGNVWSNGYLVYDGADRLQGAGLTPEYGAAYNCLFGKKALWNGDSICAADNDAQGGWPFRIAAANGMYAWSSAVAGGCIAENVPSSGGTAHSVCGTLDTMLAVVSDADYIIIEGGTNDADLLGTTGIGTFDDDDFSTEYIAALDTDTFSGALESIFYRLVTQMKGKHIGYIIPQKMGHTAELVARRRTYFDRAIDICKKWGIPYIDLWNGYYFNWQLSAHWDSTMSTAENEAAGNLYIDGQHLTTTGYAIQSPVIAEWMKTI